MAVIEAVDYRRKGNHAYLASLTIEKGKITKRDFYNPSSFEDDRHYSGKACGCTFDLKELNFPDGYAHLRGGKFASAHSVERFFLIEEAEVVEEFSSLKEMVSHACPVDRNLPDLEGSQRQVDWGATIRPHKTTRKKQMTTELITYQENETTNIAFVVDSDEALLALIAANTTETAEEEVEEESSEWDILDLPNHKLKKAIIEMQPSNPWVWVKAVEKLGYKLGWIYYNWAGYAKQNEFDIGEYQEYLDSIEGADEAYTAQMMLEAGAYYDGSDLHRQLSKTANYSKHGDMMAQWY